MKRLALRNMISGGALSAVRLVSGVIKIKIVALWLGVSGVGLFSLFAQAVTTGIALVSMSLAIPMINLGRRHVAAGDYRAAGKVAGTVLSVLACNALVAAGAWLLLGSQLIAGLGGPQGVSAHGWPLLIAVLAGAAASSFFEGLTFLCDRFDAYVRASMTSAVVDALAIGGAAWAFGLDGAILALPAAPLSLLIAFAVQMARDGHARRVFAALGLDLKLLPQVFNYCALMVGTISLTNLVQTTLRSRVLAEAGAEPNGYLQVATALSSYLLSFVMTGFWGHLHARAAAEGDTAEVRAEFGKSARLGLLISFAGCMAAVILGPWVVAGFYASSFAPATGYLRPYLLGEFAFQFFSMLVAYQLTIGHRRRYAALNLAYIGILGGAGLWLVPRIGAAGYVLAHGAAAGIAALAAVAVCLRVRQFGMGMVAIFAGAWAVLAGFVLLFGGFAIFG